MVDQLLPWGIQTVAGIEFTVAPKLRFMIEYAPTCTPLPIRTLLAFYFSQTTAACFRTSIFHPPSLSTFSEVRMGLRWAL